MRISKKIKDRLVDAIITAFVFAASLTWKDAFISIIDTYIPGAKNSPWTEVFVAGLITLTVVVAIYILIKSDYIAEERLPIFKDDEAKENISNRQ